MPKKLSTNKEWKNPRLIQRLEGPGYVSDAWGGKQTCIRLQQRETLGKILRFAYMGNSEFEWGELPLALNTFSEYASRNKIMSMAHDVSISVGPSWDQTTETATVFVLCPRKLKDDVERFLNGHDFWRTAEPTKFRETMLRETLATKFGDAGGYGAERTEGWFDLDNQVFFFKNREMFEQVRAAFHIKDRTVPVLADVKPMVSVTPNGFVPVA